MLLGKVSITIDTPWFEAGSDAEEDQEAAERMMQFSVSDTITNI